MPSPDKDGAQLYHGTLLPDSRATETSSSPTLKDAGSPKGHRGGALGLTPPATYPYHSQCGFRHLKTCSTHFKVYLGNLAKPVGTVLLPTIFFLNWCHLRKQNCYIRWVKLLSFGVIRSEGRSQSDPRKDKLAETLLCNWVQLLKFLMGVLGMWLSW